MCTLRCFLFLLPYYFHVYVFVMPKFSRFDKREVLQQEYSQPPILPSPHFRWVVTTHDVCPLYEVWSLLKRVERVLTQGYSPLDPPLSSFQLGNDNSVIITYGQYNLIFPNLICPYQYILYFLWQIQDFGKGEGVRVTVNY